MSRVNFNSSLLDKFVNQTDCDVSFICPDPESETGESSISAHKLVLSLASDVFNTMFYGETSKSEVILKSNVVKVDDIQMPVFKLFLIFIYSDAVKFENREIVRDFHSAAHKYQCKDALDFVISRMIRDVEVNSIFYCNIACLYGNEELKTACSKVFETKTSDIINGSEFLTADPRTIETLFKLDTLNINSETDLMKALERYIEKNKENDLDIASKVRPAINCIRFLTLSWKDISDTSLLTSEEIVCLMKCLKADDLSCIPAGLSINKNKRQFIKDVHLIIRTLSQVYSSFICYNCIRLKGPKVKHGIWSCSKLDSDIRATLRRTYHKYYHAWLSDYELDDVMTIYDVFIKIGFDAKRKTYDLILEDDV